MKQQLQSLSGGAFMKRGLRTSLIHFESLSILSFSLFLFFVELHFFCLSLLRSICLSNQYHLSVCLLNYLTFCIIDFFLLGSHLRLGQWEDDPDEG